MNSIIKKKVNEIATIEELRRFLQDFFGNKKVEVYLFGSRARGDNSQFSDVDLAIMSNEDISDKVTILKALLEESNLPFKVDLIDLKKALYLKETIEKEGVKWI